LKTNRVCRDVSVSKASPGLAVAFLWYFRTGRLEYASTQRWGGLSHGAVELSSVVAVETRNLISHHFPGFLGLLQFVDQVLPTLF
jgi:hypothetical protein